MNYHHFITGKFTAHSRHLDEVEYAQVLDNVVVATADCVLINHDQEILLGKRTREPQPDWWIVGGRMSPGESMELAAARNLKRELSLDVDPLRFKYVGCYSMVWGRRAQPPQENGSHTLSVTMMITVDANEIEQLKSNDEYHELKWRKLDDVIMDNALHPALHTLAIDVKNILG